uniref:NADH-ubiquinone oxidoreductase chain 1 n=1 Tax=Pseudochauhanea macrorchis TaxID=1086615 RepID=H6U4R9_PSEMH|nr:NADH dehydrogenase subunit 1 [Pseudochauhanea macrorchis]AEO93255.1 NADH dehydrogenase subunit 1 [Pseudochauhanea macrorchis]
MLVNLSYLSLILYLIVGLLFFLLVFFFVLIERKILGLCQSRLGPNKVSFIGILQSLADFIKLLGKLNFLWGLTKGLGYRGLFYWFGVFYFFLAAAGFICIFIKSLSNSSLWGSFLCWVIVLSSLSGYGFILCGWGSISKYSLLGAMRASFSGISFEGCLMCIVIGAGLLISSYCSYFFNNKSAFGIISLLTLYILSVISVMCECNRSPFDFSESESDLVSGFNTDYYGASFAILFACEYAVMVFFSWFISFIFFNESVIFLTMFFHSFLLIFVRACFPRLRYDYFVSLFWKNLFVIYFLSLFVLL